MKKILVLATGGTIASNTGENGLTPTVSSNSILSELDKFKQKFIIDYKDILNLDSSNIQAEEWQTIVKNIWENLPKYDAIIILHGTDTMAYTASMMSYMLQNLNKPVVFTGSQVPMGEFLSDASQNLSLAFATAEKGVNGITVAFNNKVIEGTRAVKIRTKGFDAFESINANYRAQVFADGLEVYPTNRDFSKETTLKSKINNEVFLLKLIPGTNPSIIDMLMHMNYKGLIIETFGAGGMHYLRRDLLSSIKNLVDNNIPVAVCSQCLYEQSDLSIYEVGQKLLSTGVISTGDMTTEAIVTKMMWALGQSNNLNEIREIFSKCYSGEISL